MEHDKNLLALLQEDGVATRRAASTDGGEYCGRCPFCAGDGQSDGGRDRFRVWPNHTEPGWAFSGRWWCRKCRRSGNTLDYLRQARRMTAAEACELLGLPAGTMPAGRPCDGRGPGQAWSPKPAVIPPAAWRASATALAQQARDRLFHSGQGGKLLRWLEDCRFLDRAAVERAGLGLIPEDGFFDLEAWGLPPEVNPETGRDRKVWVPAGLLIPVCRADEVVFLQVRRFGNTDSRYVTVRGSGGGIMWVGPENAEVVAVVESRLDALHLHERLGGAVATVALGCAQARPDTEVHDLLTRTRTLLVMLDTDESGGLESRRFWQPNFRNALRLALPEGAGKDPCEATAAGLDIAGSVTDALKAAGREVPAALAEHRRNYQRVNMERAAMDAANKEVLDIFKTLRPTRTGRGGQEDPTAMAHVAEFWREILWSGVSNPGDTHGDAQWDRDCWHRMQAEDSLYEQYTEYCVHAGAAPLSAGRFLAVLEMLLPRTDEQFVPFPGLSERTEQVRTLRTFVKRPSRRTGLSHAIFPYKGSRKKYEGERALFLPGIEVCRQHFCEATGTPVAWPEVVDQERRWFTRFEEKFRERAAVAAWYFAKLRSARSVWWASYWQRRVRLDYLLSSCRDYCARHGFEPPEDTDEFRETLWGLLPKGQPPSLMLWQRLQFGPDVEIIRSPGVLLPDLKACRLHFAEIAGIDGREFGEPEASEEVEGNPRSVQRYWQAKIRRGVTVPDERDPWQTKVYWNRLPSLYALYCDYCAFCREEDYRRVRMGLFLECLFAFLPGCETLTARLYRMDDESGRWTAVDDECLVLDAWKNCAECFERLTGAAVVRAGGPVAAAPPHRLAEMEPKELLLHWWASELGREGRERTSQYAQEGCFSHLLGCDEDDEARGAVLDACGVLPRMPRVLVERRFRRFLRRHGLNLTMDTSLKESWKNLFEAISETEVPVQNRDPGWLSFSYDDDSAVDKIEWYTFRELGECRANIEALLGRALDWPTLAVGGRGERKAGLMGT